MSLRCCRPFAVPFGVSLLSICLLQLLLSNAVIWYVGYQSSEMLINNLSMQLRPAALATLCEDIHTTLVSPMRAVLALSSMVAMTIPDLANTAQLYERPGVLAAISLIPILFPEVSSAGCSTRNGELIAMINISATNSLLSTNLPYKEGIMYAVMDARSNDTVQFRVPRSVSSNQGVLRVSSISSPDFNLSSTTDDLGGVNYQYGPCYPQLTAQFLAGSAARGQFAWSRIFPLSVDGHYSAVSATKATLTDAGAVGYACYSSIYLNRMGDLLKHLKSVYGEHGISVVLDTRDSQLLAVSDLSLSQLVGDIVKRQNNNTLLDVIASVLTERSVLPGSLSPTAGSSNASSSTTDFTQESTAFTSTSAFDAVPISLYGDAYHLQATVLVSTGQTWIVVVVTKDSDFDGHFQQRQLVAGLVSMAVIVVSVVAMLLFTRCLTMPLRRMVLRMSQVTKVERTPTTQVRDTLTRSQRLAAVMQQWQQPSTEDSFPGSAQHPDLVAHLDHVAVERLFLGFGNLFGSILLVWVVVLYRLSGRFLERPVVGVVVVGDKFRQLVDPDLGVERHHELLKQ